MLLYGELVPWYHLIDPYEGHREEAACYREALEKGAGPSARTLLELGAGAGGNAYYLKERFSCTLTDLSEEMLSLSRALNPDCEHLAGDMRTMRLGRTFDTVLAHDAIGYMISEAELEAAMTTAFLHTKPGGVALFTPDFTRESFDGEACELLEEDADGRAMRGIEWCWDPDPKDSTFMTEYSFLLRDRDGSVRSVHDRHLEGIFDRATWKRLLSKVGFAKIEMFPRKLDDDEIYDEIFLCYRA